MGLIDVDRMRQKDAGAEQPEKYHDCVNHDVLTFAQCPALTWTPLIKRPSVSGRFRPAQEMVSWISSANASSQAFYSSLSAVGMQIGAESRSRVERQLEMTLVISPLARKRELDSGVVGMGEIIRFVPRSELERARLIREARAIYDSIFPPADSANEQREPRK